MDLVEKASLQPEQEPNAQSAPPMENGGVHLGSPNSESFKHSSDATHGIIIVKVEDNGSRPPPYISSSVNSSDSESHARNIKDEVSGLPNAPSIIKRTSNDSLVEKHVNNASEDNHVRDEAALAMAALASIGSLAKPALVQQPSSSSQSSFQAEASGALPLKSEPSSDAPLPSTAATGEQTPTTISPSLQPSSGAHMLPQQVSISNNRDSTQQSQAISQSLAAQQQQQMYEATAAAHAAATAQAQQSGGVAGTGGYYGSTMNEMMMMAYAQQQQQQSMMGMIPSDYIAALSNQGLTQEEILRIITLQEQIQQQAAQFAQANYVSRIQSGVGELMAKEEARLVFQEMLQKGQQSLQMQVQVLLQQKIQTMMQQQQQQQQQQRAMETMRLQQQQATVAGSGRPSLGAVHGGAAPPTKLAPVLPVGAFNMLCQAADERPTTTPLQPVTGIDTGSSANGSALRSASPRISGGTGGVKEDPEMKKWRSNLLGKVIEVEYDGEWYAAKVMSREQNVFVVVYDEDDTEEKMRLFNDYTAEDPEGDDSFRWRMKAKKERPEKGQAGRKRKSNTSTVGGPDDDDEDLPAAVEEESTRKSVDGISEGSSSKLDAIREQRERRAELRAQATARRLEDETLANAKKLEQDALALKKRAEEEFKGKKEKFDEDRKVWEVEKKRIEEERASFEKLKHEIASLKQQNEAALKAIRDERIALEKARARAAKSQSSSEEELEDEDDNEGKAQDGVEEQEDLANKRVRLARVAARSGNANESKPGKVNGVGRRSNSKKEQERSDSDSAEEDEGQEEEIDNAAVESSSDDEEEENEDQDEEQETPSQDTPAVKRKPGRPKGSGKKTPTAAAKETSTNIRVKSVTGKKTGASKPAETGSGGKTRNSLGKAPRALGYLSRGKFGFVPPSGPKALAWRVRVWWKDDKRFYEGMVDSFRNGRHKVLYDDGDVEWLYLDNETIEWFVPEGAEFAPLSIDPVSALALA